MGQEDGGATVRISAFISTPGRTEIQVPIPEASVQPGLSTGMILMESDDV